MAIEKDNGLDFGYPVGDQGRNAFMYKTSFKRIHQHMISLRRFENIQPENSCLPGNIERSSL